MRKRNVLKSMAIMFSMFCMMFFTPIKAKSCELLWCGGTIVCNEDPCRFNVGTQFAIVTCGDQITIYECVPDED